MVETTITRELLIITKDKANFVKQRVLKLFYWMPVESIE